MTQQPEPHSRELIPRCAECGDEVPNYTPEFCCNGRDCLCRGQAQNLPFCSVQCKAAYKDREEKQDLIDRGELSHDHR